MNEPVITITWIADTESDAWDTYEDVQNLIDLGYSAFWGWRIVDYDLSVSPHEGLGWCVVLQLWAQ